MKKFPIYRKDSVLTGFTIIELMLIVIIMGAILSISFPRFNDTYRYRMIKETTERIESFIKYVQTKSKIDRKDYKVIFNPKDNKYWYVVKNKDKNLVSKKYKISSFFELENEGNKEIWFYPDKTSSGELSIVIKDPREDYIFKITKDEGISKVYTEEVSK